MCEGHPALPLGLSDIARRETVKIFCPRCQDIYRPRLSLHSSIDGAFFGTTFAHLFMMHYKMDMRPVPVNIHQNPYSHSLKSPNAPVAEIDESGEDTESTDGSS